MSVAPLHRIGSKAGSVSATVLASMSLTVAGAAEGQSTRQCYLAEFQLEQIVTPTTAVWVPEDQPLFDARLLPMQLWEVTAEVDLDGTTVLRAGDQLMTMVSNTPTRCNFPQRRDSSIAARQRVCLFDPDRDGVFDRAEVRGRGAIYWFAMAWEHPDEMIAVDPVSMREIEPAAFRGGPSIKYFTAHIPLRRRPRDGSPPYYEAFTIAMMYGNDGLNEQLHLDEGDGEPGILGDDVVEFEGLTIRFDEIAAETTLVTYSGNFDGSVVQLPFENSYEHRCDINSRQFLNRGG